MRVEQTSIDTVSRNAASYLILPARSTFTMQNIHRVLVCLYDPVAFTIKILGQRLWSAWSDWDGINH